MFKRQVEASFERPTSISEEKVMKVRDISTKSKLNNISFDLSKGEILGFFGLMGAGRTELAKALFGYDKISSGEIEIGNKNYKKFKCY